MTAAAAVVVVVVAALGSGCGSTPPRAAGAAAAAGKDAGTDVAGPAPARIAYYRGIASAGGGLPAGADAAALCDELVGWLSALDPAVRDGIAYTLLARWIVKDGLLDAGALRKIELRLRSLRRAGLGGAPEPDAVFGRSFAALGSALVVAREVAAPAWSDAELAEAIADAGWYAAHELDLRGHVEGRGWAHAVAHTADWIRGLARHPRLDRAGAAALLDAVLGLALRPHGVSFHHGEDARLAAPVVALVARDLLDDAAVRAALERLVAAAKRWEEPFDLRWYAAQRNARNLLLSVYVALALDRRPPGRGTSAARAMLDELLGGS